VSRPARHKPNEKRARLAPALIALAALLVQALMPSAAMAARAAGAPQTVVVCTAMGVKIVTVGKGSGQDQKGFAGLPCQDCLAAATATLPPPEPMSVPVAYAVAYADPAPRPETAPKTARAPPRPLGQGPPAA
jgi:hypothetical protein